ncbi:RNA exonuclease 5 [Seminavis robusta]|uniref:RNA exonuclease 5 n=1 Tax=Seminavis robusta TaxID=568900 RepID=A0A9N8E5T5_9STRA|nr:RNA exonuclease 5 [Seminavis robusta]|eukprot:Sro545_g163950.1 RNA exonuclease 5 (697) ;mRNA; r:56094-58288
MESPPTKTEEGRPALSSDGAISNKDKDNKKDQKKRFKKLRKRAERFCLTSDVSGIVQSHEWEEVKQQHLEEEESKSDDSLVFAPWIGIRQSRKHLQEKDKVRDGVDHRLALKYLVSRQSTTNTTTGTSTSKNGNNPAKRTRDESNSNGINATVPAWMTMHNPACADHIAVLEIHLQNNTVASFVSADVEAIMKKLAIGTSLTEAAQPIPTRWFEGPRLQSISEVLLYEKPQQQNSKKKSKKQNGNTTMSTVELLESLQSLTLTEEQLQNEGYPLPESLSTSDETSKSEQVASSTQDTVPPKEFPNPTSFSLEEANAIVTPCHVNVPNRKVPFVMTKKLASTDSGSCPRVFGLDCEMVKTKIGTELARVTLIEYTTTTAVSPPPTDEATNEFKDNYQVLLDELVLPYSPIFDYVTEYSGISAKMMQNVTTRLEQIQASLLSYISPRDILVGHSLENDLVATRWIHCTVIDTAILFRTKASFKHSLKHLSINLLKKKIQQDFGNGHCSEEDAAATLELAIRRAKEGPSFALQSKEKIWWIPTRKHNENATVCICPSQWLQEHVVNHPNAIHALTCDDMDSPNLKAVISWLTGPRRRAGLLWANLSVSKASHVKILENMMLDLKAKMSANTVLMVNVQSGHEPTLETSKRRRLCQSPRTASVWSDGDEEAFKASVDGCRTGQVWWVTKHPPMELDSKTN